MKTTGRGPSPAHSHLLQHFRRCGILPPMARSRPFARQEVVVGRLMVMLVSGLVFVSTAAAVAQQEYPATATIRGENIWLREDPAEETTIVTYLQRGDQIRVTGDATAADGDSFYPVEVVDTGETGWVRALALDPRTFALRGQLPVVDVDALAATETSPQDRQPRRNRNRAARSESDVAAGDEPARRNTSRQSRRKNPRPATTARTGTIDCGAFTTQAEAQAYFDEHGWSATNDPYGLDQGGAEGVPCESLP
jgi:hypothetical protein